MIMETYNNTNAPKRSVNLYLEANPNPNSLKFVANYMLVPEGESFDFPDKAAAEHAPLALELLELDYVDRVFFMSNFVTVTKVEDKEWEEIKEPLKAIIKEYLEADKPLITKFSETTQAAIEETEIEKSIKNVLDEYVRPAVEQDGGAISFHSYNEGVVKVLLQGSCSGCPSATVTLKAGIENLLKRMIPEVTTVEAEGV